MVRRPPSRAKPPLSPEERPPSGSTPPRSNGSGASGLTARACRSSSCDAAPGPSTGSRMVAVARVPLLLLLLSPQALAGPVVSRLTRTRLAAAGSGEGEQKGAPPAAPAAMARVPAAAATPTVRRGSAPRMRQQPTPPRGTGAERPTRAKRAGAATNAAATPAVHSAASVGRIRRPAIDSDRAHSLRCDILKSSARFSSSRKSRI